MRSFHPLRNAAFAATAAFGLLGANAALAQPAPPDSEPSTRAATVSRSARKATTYKMGTVMINAGALTYALGPVGGGVVTAITAVTSWSIYTANDYFWDKAYPPTPAPAGQGFDIKAEAWRTTLKYATFKPLVLLDKCTWLFLWTGSSQTALTWGMGIGASLTVWFYTNNLGWDLYEYYTAPDPTPKAPTLALMQ